MFYLTPNTTVIANAVKKAGKILTKDFAEIEQLQSSVNGAQGFALASVNKVKEVLVNELKKARPNFAILQENDKPTDKASCFVICPVCGVQNYINGLPNVCISVAIVENNAITCAVIYNPITDDMYFAEKGSGAFKEGFRNQERLRVSSKKELADSIVLFNQVDSFPKELSQNARVLGNPALDLAKVASGKADGAVSKNNTFAQVAAGFLLVKEAGGCVYGLTQQDIRSEHLFDVLQEGAYVCTNYNLGKKIKETL